MKRRKKSIKSKGLDSGIAITIDDFRKRIQKNAITAYTQAHDDCLIYGTGFIEVTSDLKLNRISAKQALKKAKFIEENKYKPKSKKP